jgi:hypothetical protein
MAYFETFIFQKSISQDEISALPIAYDFDKLVNEYFEQSSSSKNYGE